MAVKRRAAGHEVKATQRASGQARSLAESMPRLILEARRIAATVQAMDDGGGNASRFEDEPRHAGDQRLAFANRMRDRRDVGRRG